MRRTAILALALAAACTGATDETHPGKRPHQANADLDWRDQVIYQIMVDRFADGDPNNNINVEPSVPGRYHGGDWQGVIDHLDYLEDLGVTALWISPVVKNTEEDAGFASYHGYWTQDFLRPNAHFGDINKLRELVDKAHERGMLVILDVVTNHVGQLFFYDINGNGQPDDTLFGGGLSHTCVQICNNPGRASECTADERTYCDKGKDYLERIIEWDPEYDPRGIQGWSSLGFSGPADIRFPDWPDKNRTPPPRPPAWFGWPDDKPWFDDPSWYHRNGRVYTWWHEGDYSREFIREQETRGDFPGGLKDLDTDHPDVQEALARSFEYWIEVADFDGFRIDTVKHIDQPELDLNVRAFWGMFADRMRAKAKQLGKQNFFIFGEAFDGNDGLIGAYTFPGQDAQGAFGRLDSVFYFSQYYRGINPVFKQGAPTHNLECLYNSRVGKNPGDTFCSANGYAAGPTFYGQPVASAEGGVAARRSPAAGQLPRQPRSAAVPVLRRRVDRDRRHAPGRAVLQLHVGRDPVPVLRHRAGPRRWGRPEEPRGHEPRQPGARLRAVRDRSPAVHLRAGPHRDAQGARGAAARDRRREVVDLGRGRPARRRHLRVRAGRAGGDRAGGAQHVGADQRDLRRGERRRRVHADQLPGRHGAPRRVTERRRRDVHGGGQRDDRRHRAGAHRPCAGAVSPARR